MRLSPETLLPNGTLVTKLRSQFPSAISIHAFGSQLQGTAGAEGDLDLAVLVAGYAEPMVLWETAGKLSELTSCPVDLLDLRAASTVMQYQLITTGQRLWSSGLAADLFECFVLSEKTNLDEARAGLLQDIAAAGKIYA
jgi:predicted nucleotidyltransferase